MRADLIQCIEHTKKLRLEGNESPEEMREAIHWMQPWAPSGEAEMPTDWLRQAAAQAGLPEDVFNTGHSIGNSGKRSRAVWLWSPPKLLGDDEEVPSSDGTEYNGKADHMPWWVRADVLKEAWRLSEGWNLSFGWHFREDAREVLEGAEQPNKLLTEATANAKPDDERCCIDARAKCELDSKELGREFTKPETVAVTRWIPKLRRWADYQEFTGTFGKGHNTANDYLGEVPARPMPRYEWRRLRKGELRRESEMPESRLAVLGWLSPPDRKLRAIDGNGAPEVQLGNVPDPIPGRVLSLALPAMFGNPCCNCHGTGWKHRPLNGGEYGIIDNKVAGMQCHDCQGVGRRVDGKGKFVPWESQGIPWAFNGATEAVTARSLGLGYADGVSAACLWAAEYASLCVWCGKQRCGRSPDHKRAAYYVPSLNDVHTKHAKTVMRSVAHEIHRVTRKQSGDTYVEQTRGQTCLACDGSGVDGGAPCEFCAGTGEIQKERQWVSVGQRMAVDSNYDASFPTDDGTGDSDTFRVPSALEIEKAHDPATKRSLVFAQWFNGWYKYHPIPDDYRAENAALKAVMALDMLANGKSYRDAADKLGVRSSTLQRWVDKAKAASRKVWGEPYARVKAPTEGWSGWTVGYFGSKPKVQQRSTSVSYGGNYSRDAAVVSEAITLDWREQYKRQGKVYRFEVAGLPGPVGWLFWRGERLPVRTVRTPFGMINVSGDRRFYVTEAKLADADGEGRSASNPYGEDREGATPDVAEAMAEVDAELQAEEERTAEAST